MNYKMTITTLTPVHIGTGTELLNLYDFKVNPHQRKTYRLNVDTILDQALTGDVAHLDTQLLGRPPAELVELKELYPGSKFVTYTLDGMPQPKTEGAGRINEQIKDVWGQLYLPGSTVKGALRTVIARNMGASETFRPSLQVDTGADPRQAAGPIEQTLFGRNPNYDLLRALQVADSRPVEANPRLINVRIVKGKQLESPVDVEAIPPQTVFETRLRTDEYLYKEKRADLEWDPEQTKWLYNLPIAGRNVARVRFAQERAYFKRLGLTRLTQIYGIWETSLKQLRRTQTFYLQLGWGGGWDNKTLGRDLIAGDDAEFADIRNRFKLGQPPGRRDWRAKPEDTFPASRRLRVDAQGQPMEPLGWVEVTLTAL
jgi:CRISPR-associated protein Csm5